MTDFREQWYAVADNFDTRDFKAIQNPLHPNRSICGQMKLASLLKNGQESYDPHSEHDILYLCPTDALKPLTQEDIIYLLQCGVHWSSTDDSLAMFN